MHMFLHTVVIRTPKASGWRPFILPTPLERFYSHVLMVCSAERGKTLFEIASHLSAPLEWVEEAVEFWMNVGMLREKPLFVPPPTPTQTLRSIRASFPPKPTLFRQVLSFVTGLFYG